MLQIMTKASHDIIQSLGEVQYYIKFYNIV